VCYSGVGKNKHPYTSTITENTSDKNTHKIKAWKTPDKVDEILKQIIKDFQKVIKVGLNLGRKKGYTPPNSV